MSRGFSATLGVGTTDRITATAAAATTSSTYSMWTFRNGDGGGGFGRVFDNDASTVIFNDFDGSGSGLGSACFAFSQPWSISGGIWTITRPTTGSWHLLTVTYSSAATTNNAIWYVDGVVVTATQVGVDPAGTPSAPSAAWRIGNRSDSIRAWDGLLAEFARWSRILTQDEITGLAAGMSPLAIPVSLAEYVMMTGRTTPISKITAAPVVVATLGSNNDPPLLSSFKSAIGAGIFRQ